MESFWRNLLWEQFGAAIDMLDNAVKACPDDLWRQPVWRAPAAADHRTEFWYITYHALYWLDLYLFGAEEGFAPPAPFALTEQDDANGPLPAQVYTKADLRGYLAALRQKCQTTITTMTDDHAHRPVNFGWMQAGEVVSFAELQLYNLRHIQEHAAQLSLILGQHGVPDAAVDWVTRA